MAAKPETKVCQASVSPHDCRYSEGGPLDFSITNRNQPRVVRNWPKGYPARIRLEQPDERTNLTIARLSFGAPEDDDDQKWYSVTVHRRPDYRIRAYVKTRVTHGVEHPVPIGLWQGTVTTNGEWALYIFQHQTLILQDEESSRRIVIP